MAVFSRSNMFSPDLQGEAAVQHFFTKVLDIILNFLASKKLTPEEDRNGTDFTMKNPSLFGDNMVHKGAST
ncbi:hypothetical protein [Rothia sp. (in: high G+C Gram-positive bacteria)]|uniref:hypothetical protein n=1 Tax=Rothia sp. (in: high G+C Gram-positive bacteria) TaxID=1885016 RepID=UPI0026C8A85F